MAMIRFEFSEKKGIHAGPSSVMMACGDPETVAGTFGKSGDRRNKNVLPNIV